MRGTAFTWTAGEHCLVLTGYDNNSYFFNDPLSPYGGISYPKKLVKERYAEMGRQAILLSK